ncbi:MAG: DUF2807 domain-containing protein [Clostridia bacterium]|nr:DUF2807 domain-containing protein [Clostridia bacterium]
MNRMTRHFLMTICMVLALICTGCSLTRLNDAFKVTALTGAEKTTVTELSYDEAGLDTKITIHTNGKSQCSVTVLPPEEGKAPYAVLTYPSDIEDYGFFAECKGGVFSVGTKDDRSFGFDSFTITIYADVKKYDMEGSFHIDADCGEHAFDTLSLNVSGAVECKLKNISAGTVRADVAGAGDIVLLGAADSIIGSITGAGELDSSALQAKTGNVTVSGAGWAKVNASDTLNVTVNGAGCIEYLGTPTVTKSISGAGAVKAVNE